MDPILPGWNLKRYNAHVSLEKDGIAIAHFQSGLEEQDPNIAFIVRAVNSHEELLAVLKLICTMAHKSIADNPGLKTLMPAIAARADKAIAKAEGK